MRIYSIKPIDFINHRAQMPLRAEDLLDENVFEDVWLPSGDDPETDIFHLLEQNRLSR
ncbi:hypothetical protein ASZ90_019009 [hydrocarbon metagenome]|uniref:Uncharacterized protein n=1 Tax=hydrocarbon metagenome TaxID=938273 RepID=A0A0W8E4J7_9ZZZZ